jgi:raffinose/stachyose/melibiose transport system permease protein
MSVSRTRAAPSQKDAERAPRQAAEPAGQLRARLVHWVAVAIRQGLVIGATLLSLFPVYFMAVAAFKTRSEYLVNKWGLPLHPALTNFNTAFSGEKFFIRFANSTILTAGSVAISLVIACLAAYAFARMPFAGKRVLFNLVLALMVVPPVVMVVPLFISLVNWKLINTYQGTILIYVGLLLPFSVYLMTNFFQTIPREIVDAARIDGCSTFGVFWSIMMPLSAPAILTLVVVNAMWVWNELLIALIFLQKDELKTLMVGIASMRSRNYVDIPATMAGLLVATVPIVVLYLAGQRYFIRGLVSGAVK